MTDFLVDSTVHIHWARGFGPAVDWLDGHAIDELNTSVISIAEVYSGASPSQLDQWPSYFRQFKVIGIDEEIAVFAGELRYGLARQGYQIHLPDALIAATAILRAATVVTANAKDFVITGAQVFELSP
ncbi:MAG: type II toxin-antitoxin system VapC family toxin [bacterium]